MLSLPNDGRYPTLDLAPQQRRQRTLEALTAQIEALTRQSPVLMIFEDAHWIDPTSLEALGRAVDRITTLGVLLIVTYRPEFEPPWIGRPHVTALTLNRLAEREISAMIDGVVGNKLLRASIRQDIIERTDGIPLFVEEMTKAVLEAEERGRSAAHRRRCSVSGRSGPRKLARLADGAARPARPRQGGGADRGGDRAGVLPCPAGCGGAQAGGGAEVRRSTVSLRLVCCSGRACRRMRPTCSSMPWCRTRPMARCCASRDARFTPVSPKPLRASSPRSPRTSRSCWHVTAPRPGSIEKAAGLWGKAGQRSLERSALVEAIEQLTRALDQIATLPATPALRREQIKLQVALITPLFHVKGYAAPETKAAAERARLLIEQAEALGEPPEDPLLLFSVLYGFWVANYVAFNGDVMRELAAQFLALAEKQGATVPLMIGHRLMGMSLLEYGRHRGRSGALRSGDRALRSCRASSAGDAIWPRRRGGNLVLSVVGPVVAWLSRGRTRGRRPRAQGCTRDRPRRHVDVCAGSIASFTHIYCGNYADSKRARR